MASLREIWTKIKSVKSTQQNTKYALTILIFGSIAFPLQSQGGLCMEENSHCVSLIVPEQLRMELTDSKGRRDGSLNLSDEHFQEIPQSKSSMYRITEHVSIQRIDVKAFDIKPYKLVVRAIKQGDFFVSVNGPGPTIQCKRDIVGKVSQGETIEARLNLNTQKNCVDVRVVSASNKTIKISN